MARLLSHGACSTKPFSTHARGLFSPVSEHQKKEPLLAGKGKRLLLECCAEIMLNQCVVCLFLSALLSPRGLKNEICSMLVSFYGLKNVACTCVAKNVHVQLEAEYYN